MKCQDRGRDGGGWKAHMALCFFTLLCEMHGRQEVDHCSRYELSWWFSVCDYMRVPSRFPVRLQPHFTSLQCHLKGCRPFPTALSKLTSSFHSQPLITQPKSNCHHTHQELHVQDKPSSQSHCQSRARTHTHTCPYVLSQTHTHTKQWSKQKGAFVILV